MDHQFHKAEGYVTQCLGPIHKLVILYLFASHLSAAQLEVVLAAEAVVVTAGLAGLEQGSDRLLVLKDDVHVAG